MPTHTPNTGRPVADEVADRAIQAALAPARGCTRRTRRRPGSPARRRRRPRRAPWSRRRCRPPARSLATRSGGCPCRSRGRRSIRDEPSQRSLRARASSPAPVRLHASPSAFAIALNSASTTWWGERPDRKRTCSVICAVVANARTKSSTSPVSNVPIISAGMSTSCTTNGRPDRSSATSTAASSSGTVIDANRRIPALSPSASASACPSAMPDVLDRVVAVDLQVALRVDLQVQPRVRAELLQHVVEERQPGVGDRRPRAVERQLHANVGLLRGAARRWRCVRLGHAASTSSSSSGTGRPPSVVPAVTRSAFGTTAREVADQDAAVEQPPPDLGRRASAARTARSSRRRGRRSTPGIAPSAARMRSRSSRIASRIAIASLAWRSAATPAACVMRGQVVRAGARAAGPRTTSGDASA